MYCSTQTLFTFTLTCLLVVYSSQEQGRTPCTKPGGCQDCCVCPAGFLVLTTEEGEEDGEPSAQSSPFCGDEDECQADNAGCEQTCKNTPGSYTCACTEGFLLESDKHMCTAAGKSTTTASTVLTEKEEGDVNFYTTTPRHIPTFIEKAGLGLIIVVSILVLLFFAGLIYYLRFHKPTKEDTLELTHSVEIDREIHEVLFDKEENTFKKPKVTIEKKQKVMSEVVLDLVNKVRADKCLKPIKVHPEKEKTNPQPPGSAKSSRSKRGSILKK